MAEVRLVLVVVVFLSLARAGLWVVRVAESDCVFVFFGFLCEHYFEKVESV